jgi:glycosyltransferase involved in cell wall biosynthesis
MDRPMKVLVATVVHDPYDARVHAREIEALVAAGHQVTYAAPWSAYAAVPPPSVTAIDLPRAQGWHRARALLRARAVLRQAAADHDLIVLHNPELVAAVVGSPARAKTVLDVHEDLAAALVDKDYLPSFTRGPLRAVVRRGEKWAENNLKLILAEHGYQDRFAKTHPVVPNESVVPERVAPAGTDRVVYLGRVSASRGLDVMLAAAPMLPDQVSMEVLGWADDAAAPRLQAAADAGLVTWSGRIDNPTALARLEGALVGLSLLQDLPNYRHSRPTKIVEYMSRGIPVITTPLPVAVEIVERFDCGIVVPFGDARAVADAVARLAEDEDLRLALGRRGHAAAVTHFNWARTGGEFVRLLENWAVPEPAI